MHQEAEKMIGRQAQEVGEVRRLADTLIKQQIDTTKSQPAPESQEIDFFEDPVKAVSRVVESNPVLKRLEQQAAEQSKQQAAQVLQNKHPDFSEIASSTEFRNWVNGSKIRQQLFASADNYDLDAALELIETYKSIKSIQSAQTTELKKADDNTRKQTIKAASVQSGGTGESTKKIFRRADLIRLKMTDPDRYADMADEIMAAYNEGRVK
jgi:cysteinyl-tRNA synthetase